MTWRSTRSAASAASISIFFLSLQLSLELALKHLAADVQKRDKLVWRTAGDVVDRKGLRRTPVLAPGLGAGDQAVGF